MRITVAFVLLLVLCLVEHSTPQSSGLVGFLNAITCAECLVVDGGGKDYVNTTKGEETNRWGTPCSGEVTSGKLSDGCSPRYDPDMYCRWIIKPTGAQYLSLNIQNLQLEQGWDFMNISDGNGVFLGTFTGSHNSSTPPVISSSGVLDITFYTDGYNHNFGWNMSTEIKSGFNATWSVLSSGCINSCSGHGTCVDGVCQCDYNWFGSDCSSKYCSGTRFETARTGTLMDWHRTLNNWDTPAENQITDHDLYKNHMDCRWIIRPSTLVSKLRFRLWIIDLERTRDTLSFYDGNTSDAPLLATVDYNAERSLQPTAPIIQSSGGHVYIHYRTDTMTKRGGIFVTWSTVEACEDICVNGKCSGEQCVCNTGWWGGDCSVPYCLGSEVRTEQTGIVVAHSAAGRYNDKSDCIWTIQPTVPANFLMLYITFFVLESGYDFLSIHDGLNQSFPMVLKDYRFVSTFDSYMTGDGIDRTTAHNQGILEGVEPYIYSKHQVMITSGPNAYMRFMSDYTSLNVTLEKADGGARYPGLLDFPLYGPDNKMGFKLEYKAVFCGGINRFYGVTGSFTDGSDVNNYHPNQYCLFWIRANATELFNTSQRLELTVNSSVHKNDMLRILDGNTTTANVVQAYHGGFTSIAHPDGTFGTDKVTTTSNLSDGILVEFATDYTNHAEGFEISWNLVDVDPQHLCNNHPKHNLTAPFGTWSDHAGNFSSYRNSMDCNWEVQLEEYVQQIEIFVEVLSLHPGKNWTNFNSSGLAQQGLLRLGQSHHPFADWVAIYNDHQSLSEWQSQNLIGNFSGYFNQSDSLGLATIDGTYTPVSSAENMTQESQLIAITFNGTKAGSWFHSTGVYVDKGFRIRYQAVYADVDSVEIWGRGTEAAIVGRASLVTLRTARRIYAGMKDMRLGGRFHNSTTAANDPNGKYYLSQGGAQIRLRLWTNKSDEHGTEIFIAGEVQDLQTGYYYLTYTPNKIGRFRVTIEMLTEPGPPFTNTSGYGAPTWRETRGSPFYIDVSLGTVHVNGSTVTGSGLSSAIPGQLRTFTIQAGDEKGNLIPYGGHRFTGKVDGPSSIACVIKDNGDGTYEGSYTIMKAGTYNLYINLAYGDTVAPDSEAGIQGSPFQFTVAKIPCPMACSGNGECSDAGVCDCTQSFEGSDCATNYLQFYQDFLLYENIALGALIYIYCVYAGVQAFREARRGRKRASSMGDDDDSDEEEEFTGLYCCMHW